MTQNSAPLRAQLTHAIVDLVVQVPPSDEAAQTHPAIRAHADRVRIIDKPGGGGQGTAYNAGLQAAEQGATSKAKTDAVVDKARLRDEIIAELSAVA